VLAVVKLAVTTMGWKEKGSNDVRMRGGGAGGVVGVVRVQPQSSQLAWVVNLRAMLMVRLRAVQCAAIN